jgi:hypothetical protein
MKLLAAKLRGIAAKSGRRAAELRGKTLIWILNPKHETLNKSKCPKYEIQNVLRFRKFEF